MLPRQGRGLALGSARARHSANGTAMSRETAAPAEASRADDAEEFQEWRLDNWLRCRCECDDLFDMCLNCITHRQANDLVN
jgi:hypothetical protein